MILKPVILRPFFVRRPDKAYVDLGQLGPVLPTESGNYLVTSDTLTFITTSDTKYSWLEV